MDEGKAKETFLVSIILPVYNDENTIKECLQSLINQNYTNKEIIIVDDGSTDQTPKILVETSKKHQNIKILRTEHRGSSHARNYGLKNSQGDIIFFAEGDAIYDSNYVLNAVKEFVKDAKIGGVCVTGSLWVTKETIVSKFVDVENRILRKMLESGKLKPYYAWIFRKEALERVGGFDEKLFQGEDRDIFARVKKAGYSIGLVTGINWRHKRDQSLLTYMKRAYSGGKSRILYLIKYRKVYDFLKSIVFLWFCFGCLLTAPFHSLALYLLIALLMTYFFVKVSILFYQGWNDVPKRRYLIFLPFFSILRYVATGLGGTHGLLIILGRSIKGLQTEWSDMYKGA
jgi:glycosyltransferase involved in cell wall biosynthesis